MKLFIDENGKIQTTDSFDKEGKIEFRSQVIGEATGFDIMKDKRFLFQYNNSYWILPTLAISVYDKRIELEMWVLCLSLIIKIK